MREKRIGYYDYTVVLTYFGMIAATIGIFRVLNGQHWDALVCLMISGFCDMFDGTVASLKVGRTEEERRFGIQIDSLSDLISFGALPGIFVYSITGKSKISAVVCVMYILCALIRLAFYNVLEEKRQQETTERRESILGLPVTTIAVMLPLMYLMFDLYVFKNTNWFMVLLTLVSCGFLTPVEVKKPGFVGKIALILVGLFEAIGMFVFMGWEIL